MFKNIEECVARIMPAYYHNLMVEIGATSEKKPNETAEFLKTLRLPFSTLFKDLSDLDPVAAQMFGEAEVLISQRENPKGGVNYVLQIHRGFVEEELRSLLDRASPAQDGQKKAGIIGDWVPLYNAMRRGGESERIELLLKGHRTSLGAGWGIFMRVIDRFIRALENRLDTNVKASLRFDPGLLTRKVLPEVVESVFEELSLKVVTGIRRNWTKRKRLAKMQALSRHPLILDVWSKFLSPEKGGRELDLLLLVEKYTLRIEERSAKRKKAKRHQSRTHSTIPALSKALFSDRSKFEAFSKEHPDCARELVDAMLRICRGIVKYTLTLNSGVAVEVWREEARHTKRPFREVSEMYRYSVPPLLTYTIEFGGGRVARYDLVEEGANLVYKFVGETREPVPLVPMLVWTVRHTPDGQIERTLHPEISDGLRLSGSADSKGYPSPLLGLIALAALFPRLTQSIWPKEISFPIHNVLPIGQGQRLGAAQVPVLVVSNLPGSEKNPAVNAPRDIAAAAALLMERVETLSKGEV